MPPERRPNKAQKSDLGETGLCIAMNSIESSPWKFPKFSSFLEMRFLDTLSVFEEDFFEVSRRFEDSSRKKKSLAKSGPKV